jgi:hypothetical protein
LRNLLVWIASGEEEAGLALAGHRTVYQEGERIRLQAQWRDMRGQPVTDRPLALFLQPLDGDAGFESRSFSMTPLPETPGGATVVLPPLPPGRYLVRPQAAAGSAELGRQEHLVVSPHSLEATQVRQDRRALRQLTAQWGGQYVAGEAPEAGDLLAQIVAQIDLAGDRVTLRRQWDIWAGWPFLVLFVGLLGAEWFLRRRNGLL